MRFTEHLIEAFEKYYLFRRGLILLEFLAGLWVTHLSYAYAMHATTLQVSGVEIVGTVTILQAPITAMFLYTFKLYTAERRKDAVSDTN